MSFVQNQFQIELNSQANIREYLIGFLMNRPTIPTGNLIKIQSNSLLQMTQSTNQLTRNTLVRSFFNRLKTLIIFLRPWHQIDVFN
jgi:hypothetical protein